VLARAQVIDRAVFAVLSESDSATAWDVTRALYRKGWRDPPPRLMPEIRRSLARLETRGTVYRPVGRRTPVRFALLPVLAAAGPSGDILADVRPSPAST
jgi:hypothetical protein